DKFKCDHCDETFARADGKKRHMESVHTDDKFKCDHCDETFARVDGKKRHMESVHSDVRFKCDVCDISLTRYCVNSHLKSECHLNNLKRQDENDKTYGFVENGKHWLNIRNIKGDVIAKTHVDKDFYEFYRKNKFTLSLNPGGDVIINVDNKSFFLHRYIYYHFAKNPEKVGKKIDHKYG